MKNLLTAFVSLMVLSFAIAQNPGHLKLSQARFITGNNEAYSAAAYNDSNWEMQQLGETWQVQGHADYHGYAWYRIHVNIPSALKTTAYWKDSLRIFLAHVNDVDDTYLNGKLVGHTGSFPDQPGGYVSKWPAVREYHISLNDKNIYWDGDNVIAVKVFDGGGTGGIFMGKPYVDVLEKVNGLAFQLDPEEVSYRAGNAIAKIALNNQYRTSIKGIFKIIITDELSGKIIFSNQRSLLVQSFDKMNIPLMAPNQQGISIRLSFIEDGSGLELTKTETLPYLLTPVAGNKPVIRGPAIVALQPGHPLIYKVPVTGQRPLAFSSAKLPGGLLLNNNTGLITGTVMAKGDYAIQLTAQNKFGSVSRAITLRVGDTLALTPPMGWNSWNCWGTSVSDEKVRSSAKALTVAGLADHGWNYINVDDGWQAKQRSIKGILPPNEKFPGMKKLGDFLHGQGLRFGIYSSPGTHTCGGFLGSYGHEAQDAAMYAEWGVDYLKYDLCSYIDSMKNDTTLTDHQHPFKIMQAALSEQKRDVVYSICQYGLKDVWKWGRQIKGNAWRTTEDIEDTWESMYSIGFKEDTLYPYAGPGGWNDPDMLTVGMVGWGENLHPARLTADEQYTQLSLWSLLSAPLLIGCDVSRLDQFTLNLLTNDEVIGIDQDVWGKQARKMIDRDSIQVWVKELSGGRKAVGIFNINTSYKNSTLQFSEIGMNGTYEVRDVWRQKIIGNKKKNIERVIPPHGVFLFTLQ